MAKKIRFPLKMANGTDVRTIEELRTNFDLTAVLGYYADGKLITWLRDRFYDTEADKIEALDKDSKSFQSDLCTALGVTVSSEGDDTDSGDLDMDYINRRNEKRRILRELTDDEQIIYNVDSVALNQDDLLDLYDEGKKTIYLCQGEFEIPLSVTDVTYIGVANPIVTIRVTDNVNFKEKNIKFENLCYGWDISSTTPNDELRRAEYFFNKGEHQKAADVLKELVEWENPRAIMLAYHIHRDFLSDKDKLDYYCEKSERSQEIFNIIDNMSENNSDDRTEKYLLLLKKLADKGDSMSEYFYAFALFYDGENNDDQYDSDEIMKYYTLSAERGNVMAMYEIADCYYYGCGITTEENYEKAVEWYTKAAALGLDDALNQLADCYYNGYGVTQNYERAVQLYTKAAELGHDDAQNSLGSCFYYGNGVSQDYNKAVEWYTKAAEQGCAEAQNMIGQCYNFGHGVSQDYAKAIEWYTKSAEQEYRWAQYNLGNAYYNGWGVEINYEIAVEWYTKSAEQGLRMAQKELACCFYYGDGVPQDYEKAVEWFTKAAEQGYAHAQNALSACYFNGTGVSQDYEKAIEWVTKAAEHGDSWAQYNLAGCYYNGNGVVQDREKAFKLYTQAAEQGNAEAFSAICDEYEEAEDYESMIKLCTKYVNRYASALSQLGNCYLEGLGVEKDIKKALEYFSQASEKGCDVNEELKRIALELD